MKFKITKQAITILHTLASTTPDFELEFEGNVNIAGIDIITIDDSNDRGDLEMFLRNVSYLSSNRNTFFVEDYKVEKYLNCNHQGMYERVLESLTD